MITGKTEAKLESISACCCTKQGSTLCAYVITDSQFVDFLVARLTLLVTDTDNATNTYNSFRSTATVFLVKVSRPYFLMKLQGTCE